MNAFAKRVLTSATGLATAIVMSPALAQEGQRGERAQLEEVVVTGRKQEESLVDAPISILAVDGADLINANINEIAIAIYITV